MWCGELKFNLCSQVAALFVLIVIKSQNLRSPSKVPSLVKRLKATVNLIYLWLGTHDSNRIRMRGDYCELVGGWKWNTTGNKVLQGKVYSRCGWCMSGIIFKWFFFCANGIRGWVISITTDSQRQGGSDTHVIWCCTREHTAILCLQQKRTLAPYKLCFVPAKFVTEWLVVCSSRF